MHSFAQNKLQLFLQAFVKEVYVWGKLEHPNIVKLEGYFLRESFPCIVLEWAENGTIVEFIKKFPERDLVQIVS